MDYISFSLCFCWVSYTLNDNDYINIDISKTASKVKKTIAKIVFMNKSSIILILFVFWCEVYSWIRLISH